MRFRFKERRGYENGLLDDQLKLLSNVVCTDSDAFCIYYGIVSDF